VANKNKLFISRLILNPESSHVQSDMRDLYCLFYHLKSGFKIYENREKASMLYRIEETDNPQVDGIQILVQSTVPPIWNELSNFDSFLIKKPFVKEIDNVRIQNDASYHFILNASPTELSRDKRIVRLHYDQLLRWILNKGDRSGFYVEKDEIQIKRFPPSVAIKNKGGQISNLNINIVKYSGILHVINGELLVEALINGIGRGAEFGCGLLSIASKSSI